MNNSLRNNPYHRLNIKNIVTESHCSNLKMDYLLKKHRMLLRTIRNEAHEKPRIKYYLRCKNLKDISKIEIIFLLEKLGYKNVKFIRKKDTLLLHYNVI